MAQCRTESYACQELTVPHGSGTLSSMSAESRTTEDFRRTFSRRLNDALDKVGIPPKNEGRQTRLAKLLKQETGRPISQKGVRKWLEGEAMPTEGNRQALVRICRVNYQWLFGGEDESPVPQHAGMGNITESCDVGVWYPNEEPLPDGYVTIEAVTLEVGAGSRLVVTEHPEHRLRVYDADFFVRRRCNPGQCKAYRVAGDSMRPFIFDKDWVVVDTSNRTPPGPGVTDERLCTYILRIGDEIMVKMLHRLPDGSLRVSSVNPEPKYAAFTVPAQNMDTVEIWGVYLERSGGRPTK